MPNGHFVKEPWVFVSKISTGYLGGYFVKVIRGFIHNVPTGHIGGYLGGYFLREPSICLVGICQVNCFKTHNKLTLYLLGKCPFAPSVCTKWGDNEKQHPSVSLTCLVIGQGRPLTLCCRCWTCLFKWWKPPEWSFLVQDMHHICRKPQPAGLYILKRSIKEPFRYKKTQTGTHTVEPFTGATSRDLSDWAGRRCRPIFKPLSWPPANATSTAWPVPRCSTNW